MNALKTAALVSAGLAALKCGAGLWTGSFAVLASAADSFADALMSAANAWGYQRARTPADEDHPYGHGKLEGAFAVGQGMLLLGIVVSLVISAGIGLVEGRAAPRTGPAIAVLALSGACAGLLTWLLSRAAREERSVVLEADRTHYRIDLLAAAGAIAGLVAVQVTGARWLDPAIGLFMALLMARDCLDVLRRGGAELLDEALPPEELAAVRAVLERNAPRVVEFHGLRTRRSGPLRFVEVHAVVDPRHPFGEVHALAQDLVAQIRAVLPDARVLVHPDAAGMEDLVDEHLDGDGAAGEHAAETTQAPASVAPPGG